MTSFKKRVWALAKKIPCGRVTTYKEIARALDAPHAVRAVGNALSASPGPPLVPCHRVVKSSGEVGGFALGMTRKKKLLKEEGIEFRGKKIKNFKKVFYWF